MPKKSGKGRPRDTKIVLSEPVGLELDPILKPGAGKRRRPKVSPATRRAVYERDGHRCVYCQATTDLTIDHVKPLDAGGANKKGNMVTACKPCNNAKANSRAPRHIRRAMAGRGT